MKISCTQENLSKGLSIVSRMATTRATLPILANVLLAVDKGRLKLAATDLEIGITTWIGAKIEEEGGLTIPARTFADFVANNTDKTIDLSLKETDLHLKSEHYKANIKGMEASEYPLIPEIKGSPVCEIPGLLLKEAISQTVFASSSDESRPVLGGINFRFAKNELKLVATDSYRLAEKTLKNIKTSLESDIIVPSRTINELSRILNVNQAVKIFINESQILFDLGETHLISRLIEGSFPAYQQIIPDSYQTKATVNTNELASALKMASLFAKESANNIKLRLKKGSLEIIAVSQQVGDNTANIPAATDGKEIEIAFNARFILDALNAAGTLEIILELNDITERKPSALKPVETKDYTYIIMPLDIQG
jgi:DNA polymerase-3 subunit beta